MSCPSSKYTLFVCLFVLFGRRCFTKRRSVGGKKKEKKKRKERERESDITLVITLTKFFQFEKKTMKRTKKP